MLTRSLDHVFHSQLQSIDVEPLQATQLTPIRAQKRTKTAKRLVFAYAYIHTQIHAYLYIHIHIEREIGTMAQNKYYETQKWELRGTETGTKRHKAGTKRHKAGTKTHNKYDETQRRELR